MGKKRVWWYKLSSLRDFYFSLPELHLECMQPIVNNSVHLSMSFLPRRLFFSQWLKANPSPLACVGRSAVTFLQTGGFKISLSLLSQLSEEGWGPHHSQCFKEFSDVCHFTLLIKAKALCQELAWVV